MSQIMNPTEWRCEIAQPDAKSYLVRKYVYFISWGKQLLGRVY